MDLQNDLAGLGINVCNHLFDQRPHNQTFKRASVLGGIPNLLQILGQIGEFVECGQGWRLSFGRRFGNALFQSMNCSQSHVPATLQFICHEAILRIDRVELLAGAAYSLRAFDRGAQGGDYFVSLAIFVLMSQHSYLNGRGLHHTQQLTANLLVHGNSAEGNAPWLCLIHPAA